MIYRFEDHTLDCARRELRRGGRLVAIEPQVFDILQFLVGQRERVVSKDELLAEVWGDRIVSESTLNSRVAALRRAVGDSGEQQRLVRTVARKGFRFVAAVVEQPDDAAGAPAVPDPPPAVPDPPQAAPRPDRRDAPLLAQRRQLTILACCVDGQAELAARLDPEALRALLAACRAAFRRAIEGHGGRAVENTADGVLALFGYPQANEDDAENAVRAGLAAVAAAAEARLPGGDQPVRARAGIATGLVVVGDAGDTAPGHGVTGQTLHLAARLRDACPPGTVTVSGRTRRLIGGLFDCQALGGPRAVEAAAPAWQVLRESTLANRFQALHPGHAPLIGRDEQLQLLLRRWQQAGSGEGQVVLVWGEPGIGKSHLVAALQQALQDEPHGCLRFDCSPHRTQTALFPVIHWLEDASGMTPGDTDATRRQRLTQLLGPSATAQDLALFAELLSIGAGGPATLSLSAQRRRELLLERFIALLAGMAARQPLLVILEDAHWLDPTTREWFDATIDQARTLPVLLVMTYRPEFSPAWLGLAHVTTLTLNRLARRASTALVERLAEGKALAAATLEQIVQRADGVPLFIEEITRSLLDGDAPDDAAAAAPPASGVPWTLQASLSARLDRLAQVRPLVQTCAALGREFGFELIAAVMAMDTAALQPLLDQLVATGLVHQRGSPPHARYVFRHALLQDAAYDTLLSDQRLSIHQRIVEVFMHQFPDLAERQPDVLAEHCRRAGQAERAIDFAIKAALMAIERSAGVEAQLQVEGALAMLHGVAPGPSRRQLEGRLQVALADALIMTKGFASPEVAACLAAGRQLLRQSEHPHEHLRALCGLFNYHLMRSESPACLELAASMQGRAFDAPTAAVMAYLHGAANLHLGHFDASIRHSEAALSLYDDEHGRALGFVAGYHLRPMTLIWLGLGRLYVGLPQQQAAATIAAAVADARGRGHPFTLVSALLALARYCSHVGDLKGAVDATEEGLAIAIEQRSPYHVSRGQVLRAINTVEAGDVDTGIVQLEDALAAHRATGANFQSSYNLSRQAEAHARARRFERALQLADEALGEVERSGERWWQAEAQRLRGEILLAADPAETSRAQRCFEAALDCAVRQRAGLWALRAAHSLARLWSMRGRDDEAQQLLAKVKRGLTGVQ